MQCTFKLQASAERSRKMGIGAENNTGTILTLLGYAGAILVAALGFVVATLKVGWKGRDIQASLEKRTDEKVAELREEIITKISELNREFVEKRDEAMNQMGEALLGIRQAINDLKERSWESRREDFEKLRLEIKEGYTELNNKLDRIDKNRR